jgi:hypothetical protein
MAGGGLRRHKALSVRDLLGRVARAEGALGAGAACLAGLLAAA